MIGFLVTVRRYLELIRFSHTVFALPFALSASLLAWTISAERGEVGFRWQDLLGVLVCMAAARSAAMAFNRFVDRRIDAANPRTAGRHLPAGPRSRELVGRDRGREAGARHPGRGAAGLSR